MRRIAMKDGKATPNIYRAKWKNSKGYWCGVLPLNWKNCRVMFFLAGQSFWQKSQQRFEGVVFNHNFALKKKKELSVVQDGNIVMVTRPSTYRVLKMYYFFFCTNLTAAKKLQRVTWIRVSILVTGLIIRPEVFRLSGKSHVISGAYFQETKIRIFIGKFSIKFNIISFFFPPPVILMQTGKCHLKKKSTKLYMLRLKAISRLKNLKISILLPLSDM